MKKPGQDKPTSRPKKQTAAHKADALKSADLDTDSQENQQNSESNKAKDIDSIAPPLKEVPPVEGDQTDYKKEVLYLKAELDNLRKRNSKEKREWLKFGAEPFVQEILPLWDIFKQALSMKVNDQNYQSFVKGIEMTFKHFEKTLENSQIKEFGHINETYSPQLHEAISDEASNSIEKDHITRVQRTGFRFHEKVIRPAQVIVSKGPSTDESTEDTTTS